MRKYLVCLIPALVILAVACQRKALSPVEYLQLFSGDGSPASVSREVGGYEFQLLYRSPQYLALQQMDLDRELNPDSFKALEAEYSDMYYFVFKMAAEGHGEDVLKSGIQSPEEYYQRIQYLNSGVQEDLSLVSGRDTIPCSLVTFERAYGISPYTTLITVFDKPQERTKRSSQPDLTFIYRDRMLGTGNVLMQMKGTEIIRIPNVQL